MLLVMAVMLMSIVPSREILRRSHTASLLPYLQSTNISLSTEGASVTLYLLCMRSWLRGQNISAHALRCHDASACSSVYLHLARTSPAPQLCHHGIAAPACITRCGLPAQPQWQALTCDAIAAETARRTLNPSSHSSRPVHCCQLPGPTRLDAAVGSQNSHPSKSFFASSLTIDRWQPRRPWLLAWFASFSPKQDKCPAAHAIAA